MKLSPQIWVCVALITYYIIRELYDDIALIGSKRNSKNRTIEHLRTEYRVRINTFKTDKALYGSAWHKIIWLNGNTIQKGVCFALCLSS
jgi:hypothetical protein